MPQGPEVGRPVHADTGTWILSLWLYRLHPDLSIPVQSLQRRLKARPHVCWLPGPGWLHVHTHQDRKRPGYPIAYITTDPWKFGFQH